MPKLISYSIFSLAIFIVGFIAIPFLPLETMKKIILMMGVLLISVTILLLPFIPVIIKDLRRKKKNA